MNKLMKVSTVMLDEKNKILIPEGKYSSQDDLSAIVGTMSHILLGRGVVMSDVLINGLLNSKMNVEEMAAYCEHLVKKIDEHYGYNEYYKPFYPGFPKEVMELSQAEIIINAILHYISGGVIVPNSNFREDLYKPVSTMFNKVVKMKQHDLVVLHPCTMNDFFDMCDNIMSSKTSISSAQKAALCVLVDVDASRVPADIPHKENKAIVISAMLEQGVYEHALYAETNSVTDVLRIATALSNGDVSLKENTRFKSFPRPIRKWMMDTLECVPGALEEEMLKYREKWLRIGERIHPNAFPVDEFERTIDAFNLLRNNEQAIVPFGSKVERAFSEGKYHKLIDLLSKKPGYFARELHHLFKAFPERHYDIAVGFAAVAGKVATPVLLQVKGYYENKLFRNNTGIYFPKGVTQKIFVRDELGSIDIADEICNLIVIACDHGLGSQYHAKYAEEDNNKTVYVDPQLQTYLIPNSMRSASKALRTITRGSRVKMDDNRYVRGFLHWMNNECRQDIDLSVVAMNDQYKIIGRTSYYEIRNKYSVHSGDFTDAPAPKGAAEFIDVDVEAAKQNGIKYLVLCINSYSQDSFCNIPQCYAGFMTIEEKIYKERYEHPELHRVFNCEDVRMKVDLTSDAEEAILCVFDIDAGEMIWADLHGKIDKKICVNNNVDERKEVIGYMVRSVVENKRISMYELANIVCSARGYKFVDTVEEADVSYTMEPISVEDGKVNVSAYDIDVWQSMV